MKSQNCCMLCAVSMTTKNTTDPLHTPKLTDSTQLTQSTIFATELTVTMEKKVNTSEGMTDTRSETTANTTDSGSTVSEARTSGELLIFCRITYVENRVVMIAMEFEYSCSQCF
jgi:hypothetical protein